MSTATTELGAAGRWWGVARAVVVKEITVLARYPLEFAATFAQIFLMVAVFTLSALMFSPGGGGGRSMLGGTMVYGFVVFLLFVETLSAVSTSLRREQKQGTLEQLYITPASPSASLTARVFVTAAWTALMALLSVCLMAFMIGGLPVGDVATALVVLLFTVTGTFGVGFAFAGLTLRMGESAQMLAVFAQFGFMVLCAPFFPFSVLPGWLRAAASALPLAHSVDLFRSALMGFPAGHPELAPARVGLAVVVAFGVAMPPLGLWIYSSSEQWARRRGYLADY
jgi:ABC-type polysaccharide/polyol phosphate export permease